MRFSNKTFSIVEYFPVRKYLVRFIVRNYISCLENTRLGNCACYLCSSLELVSSMHVQTIEVSKGLFYSAFMLSRIILGNAIALEYLDFPNQTRGIDDFESYIVSLIDVFYVDN